MAIVGSPRLKGNTDYLVDKALEEAAGLGADTEKIVLGQYEVRPCLGHENCASFDSCRQKDDVSWILDEFYQADGVVLATPVYYYNVTAQMKAFIDRNYFLHKRNKKSRAKALGIIVVAEIVGIEDTLHTLKQFAGEAFNVEDNRKFIVSGYANKIGDAEKNLPLVKEAQKLGRQMVESLEDSS
ncbi:flavodoxin family protein [Chloroflexota bacterium]